MEENLENLKKEDRSRNVYLEMHLERLEHTYSMARMEHLMKRLGTLETKDRNTLGGMANYIILT